MKKPLFKQLANIQSKVIKHDLSIEKLLVLKKAAKRAFDERINQLLLENYFIKRIKIARSKFCINWRYVFSSPFIYGMILPALIWHTAIEIYHQICFRLYGIPLVNSKEYFIYDRKLLSWLNIFEKINCIYCSYVNNLIRYSSEIGGRTERYWCPIKYYRKINNPHSQYNKFVNDENLETLYQQWNELRNFSDIK